MDVPHVHLTRQQEVIGVAGLAGVSLLVILLASRSNPAGTSNNPCLAGQTPVPLLGGFTACGVPPVSGKCPAGTTPTVAGGKTYCLVSVPGSGIPIELPPPGPPIPPPTPGCPTCPR